MQVLVSIDDTDNIESKATGHLAVAMSKALEERGWGKSDGVTRHQLLIHPDIPYTSHNSSMCFAASLDESYLDSLSNYACDFLLHESAEGSDPGLCIALPDRLNKPELLIAFGQKAKEEIITKQEAYELAQQLGIHLSEHGGTGDGIIGALAGAGLRLSGNDGRFQGSLKIQAENNLISVGEILSQTRVDLVTSMEGAALNDNEVVRLGDMVKPVMLQGKTVLLVLPDGAGGARWRTCSKKELKRF